MPTIKLGDKCRDSISGFSGTAIAVTTWLNGCVRICIAPNVLDKDGKVQDATTFDEQQVELIEAAKPAGKPIPVPVAKTGGPKPAPRRPADPK